MARLLSRRARPADQGVLLKEPYALAHEQGESPLGRDPYTLPDGGLIAGAPWNADFRGEMFVGPDYQGYGEAIQFYENTGKQPTDWDTYQFDPVLGDDPNIGRWPSSSWSLQTTLPYVRGYSGSLQAVGMPVQLRAGQTIPFPTAGQQEPGSVPYLIDIPNAQGMDVGWQEWFSVNPRQLFEEPPNYGSQTEPMAAGGYP